MANHIREIRQTRGWTSARLNHELRHVAALKGVSTASASSLRVMISQWENDRQTPDPLYQMLLGAVFDLPPTALGFRDPNSDATAEAGLGPTVHQGVGRMEVTDEMLGYFRRQLCEHTRFDNMAGPSLILNVVTPQARVVRSLAEHGPTEVVELAARFSEFIGWLRQDSGDTAEALRVTDVAVDLAERAGNRDLAAYALMRKSNILTFQAEAIRAHVTARRAVELADRDAPAQKAVCLRQLALAEAHLRHEADVHAVIDEALALTDISINQPNELSAYCTTSYLHMERALCQLVQGRPAAAIQACTQALEHWPAGLRRDQTLCLARLAMGHLQLYQIDEACSTAMIALERVQAAPSARALHMLRAMARRLAPLKQARPVREFCDALAAVA